MSGLEQSWTERLGDVAVSVGTGVVGGAALGPVGMAVGGLVGLARSLTSQPHAADEAPALARAAQAVTGIADEAQQVAALQADPVKSEEFRLRALEVRAQAQAARDQAMLDQFKAALADNASARAMAVALAEKSGPASWTSVLLDGAVIVSFVGLLLVAMLRGLPDNEVARLIVLPAFGVLGTLATQVVQFWRGSSAGSQVKTQILAAERERR